MNRATAFLRAALSDEHYAEYRACCQLDQRDSEARAKWRHIANIDRRFITNYNERSRATALAWLQRHGYADEAGNRLGPDKTGAATT